MDTFAALRDFILNDLHWSNMHDELTPDYPLIENHAVDSMGLFTMVNFVEHKFGVTVNDEEIIPENFGTIGAIAQFIDRKRATVPSQQDR